MRPKLLAAAVVIAVAAVVSSGCSSDAPARVAGTEGTSGPAAAGSGLDVVAAFYPLQFAVAQIGGGFVSVRNLTPAGAEPHDLELTADDTVRLQDADLVVFLGGFSPAVDDGVAAVASGHALDVRDAARLDLRYSPIEDGQQSEDEATDPHFWLDPTRLADVADVVAERLVSIDPTNSATYSANAAVLRERLVALDGELASGLAACANDDIVTSHNAFGYLAERYGLRQVGITGLSPDDEPSPSDLADVIRFVEENDVRTIYSETLVDPAVAETVAQETGADNAVLDPLEGLSDASAGSDYFEVMRANLDTLRRGQGCT